MTEPLTFNRPRGEGAGINAGGHQSGRIGWGMRESYTAQSLRNKVPQGKIYPEKFSPTGRRSVLPDRLFFLLLEAFSAPGAGIFRYMPP